MNASRIATPCAPRKARLLAAAAPLALASAALLAPLAPAALQALLAPALARAADGVADVKLPWNPVDAAKGGDWAFYQVRDPDKPEERLPGERYVVQAVDEAAVTFVDSKGEPSRYARGDAGLSATAWLGGFFGEVRKGKIGDMKSLSVADDACEVAGKRYDCARIEVTMITPISEGTPTEMRSTLKMWVTRGIHGSGLVRAEAEVLLYGRIHRGILELEAHGDKDTRPPSRNPSDAAQSATGTATPAPASATPTAAPPK